MLLQNQNKMNEYFTWVSHFKNVMEVNDYLFQNWSVTGN